MAGRPKRKKRRAIPIATSYTPEVHAQIVEWMGEGNYFTTACASVGISSSTGHNWLRDGARVAGGGKPDPQRPWLLQFYLDVTKAEAQAEDKSVREWRGAGEWRAQESFLERRHPKKFGRQINVTVEEELDAALKALESGLTGAEFEKVLAIVVASREARPEEV
jgi:hypothetical protein